ncbi:hypothetical protein RHSIM_RhsimUnG0221200 [Rhododendron simsii]|uniref:Beta-glucosidase n=1 Tax=Rhododendron simsii TaxID=118357 RepID=A0A834L3X8_RHOSS|nr:hypothetical protein RHSIM_RhsimUnG0221200 [Rhododendron simsii]
MLQASCGWIYVYPQGIYETMMYIKKKYKNPIIYITENGLGEENSLKNRVTEARVDEMRTKYHIDHLCCLRDSIDDGVRVKGYFVWSLFNSFEWSVGYTNRFGLIYIEYRDGNFTRYPKGSAIWYMNFLKDKDTEAPKKQLLVPSK